VQGNNSESYKTAAQFLVSVKDFHRRAAEVYDDVARRALDPRVVMLLRYLEAHEKRLGDALAEREMSADFKQLETWVQYPPAVGVPDSLQILMDGVEPDAHQVLRTALEMGERLEASFELMAREAPIPALAEAFELMQSVQREETKRLALQFVQLMDF
jgi:hypothetical protein